MVMKLRTLFKDVKGFYGHIRFQAIEFNRKV
jgi:hypothetical protein